MSFPSQVALKECQRFLREHLEDGQGEELALSVNPAWLEPGAFAFLHCRTCEEGYTLTPSKWLKFAREMVKDHADCLPMTPWNPGYP